MTCIVAEVKDGVVHMAGDLLGSNGYTKTLGTKSKVFTNGDFIMGYTTSFRMGQLLEYAWTPPEKLNSQSEEVYIYKTVVDSIKNLLTSDGFATNTEGGTFLFGYNGKLYKMQGDFAIFPVPEFTAVGCGEDEAEACLFTLDEIEYESTMEDRLALAIKASSVRKTGVSAEYTYLSK